MLAYNAIFAMPYLEVPKYGTFWGWPVSNSLWEHTEIVLVLCYSLVLFHVWCTVTVDQKD